MIGSAQTGKPSLLRSQTVVESTSRKQSPTKNSSVSRRFPFIDVINSTILVVACVGFLVWYFPTYYTPRAMPTNPHFGAAVTFAFGEGLKDPILQPQSKLAGFLNHSAPSSLKYEDLAHPTPAGEISAYQRQHLYLMALVGLCWRLFGVDWAALGPLVGLMAAISVVSVYGMLRIRARPLVALIGAAALLTCPAQLALTHYIRDYAKTPFFLAIFFLFSVLLTRTLSASKLIFVGVALGLVTGIAAGIRQDIQIVWAVIPFLYLFGLPTGFRRMPFARVASLCLAFGLFQLLSYPTSNNQYNYTAHSVLGGAFKYNHDSMGMGGAPYIWFNEALMTDAYTNTVIQDYNRRLAGKQVDVQYLGTEYESAGHSLILDLFLHFPADFVTRFFAASLTTVRDAPWLIVGALPTMYDVDDPLIRSLQQLESGVRGIWNHYGPWLVFMGLCLVSLHSLRVAVFVTGLLIFFTGYTSLQFQPRHLWHLGVVFVCAASLLVEELLRLLGMLSRREVSMRRAAIGSFGTAVAKRMALYISIVALGTTLLLGGARFYQYRSVSALYEKYASARLIPSSIVATDTLNSGARIIKATPAPKQGDSDGRFRYQALYHALTFKGAGDLPTSVTVRNENLDVIKVQELAGSAAKGAVTIFFPALNGAANLEIEINGGDPNANVGLYTVANPDNLPIMMVLVLPQDTSSLSTHQSLVPQKRFGM
jgi:hypothetical protein